MAARSCGECKAFVFQDDGRPMTRAGRRVRRPLGVLTPCRSCPKVPADAPPYPESAVEFGPTEWAVYQHYRECKAVGWQVPDVVDPLVKLHAGLLAQVEESTEAVRSEARVLAVLAGALAGGKGKERG